MKTITLLVTTLGLFTLACKQKQESSKNADSSDTINHTVKWKTFTSDKEGFSVIYEEIHSSDVKKMKSPDGKELSVHVHYFNVQNDIFTVHWYDRDTKPGSERAELRARMISSAKRMSGNLTGLKETTVSGATALRGILLTPPTRQSPGGFKLLLMVLTPSRFYLVMASLKSGKVNRANGKKFLDAFSLLPAK